MSVPVMSIGIRSGVNWMRLNFSDIVSASLLTSSVLASPGTPISRAWPRAKRQIDNCSITSLLADDHAAELASQPIVDFPQFVDGLDVVLLELLARACLERHLSRSSVDSGHTERHASPHRPARTKCIARRATGHVSLADFMVRRQQSGCDLREI